MSRPIPELLAPAGSLDAVRAALANGADAVYLGVERFNARDDGAQLSLDDLARACALAHARGRRVYLTFNILLKPAELRDALLHLGECVERGIDAAIVQDLGAIRLIRQAYPDLEIHGSTQMTVHDAPGARLLAELGVARVVVARENTLEDLRAIREAVPELGLESFVHGALCISYSGQCYMSGMISERSANRGSCAQSCRKDYLLTDAVTGEELDRGYLISARDLAAYGHLPELAELGIRALKIEGRKKKPEFVATVTRSYRAFLDRLAEDRWAPPAPAEVQPLVQIFSRGFTGGMYGGRAGRDYVTRAQPDNRGAELGRVVVREGRELVIEVSTPVAVGDGLGFEHPDGPAKGNTGFTVSRVRTLKRGRGRLTQAVTPAPGGSDGAEVRPGWTVVRSAEAALLASARRSYEESGDGTPPSVTLDLRLTGRAGEPLRLAARAADLEVTVESEVLLAPATRHALDPARLRAQLGRLGGTPFRSGALDLAGLEGALFLPVSALNDLRQQATALLLEGMHRAADARRSGREAAVAAALAAPLTGGDDRAGGAPAGGGKGALIAEVWRLDDARAAADAGADEISLDLFLRHPTPPISRVRALAEELAGRGIPLRLRTPTIVRPGERALVDKWLALGLPVATGHAGLAVELAAAGQDVVADYPVNVFNAQAAAELFRWGVRRLVLSVELTGDEMAAVAAPWRGDRFEVMVYGRPEGMTLEHCVLSAAFDRQVATCRDLCVQQHPNVELTDPAGYVFPVATDSACRNRLLHSRPLSAAAYLPPLWQAGFRRFRLVFNVPGDPIEGVVGAYRAAVDAVAGGAAPDLEAIRRITGREFTRGHFARAV